MPVVGRRSGLLSNASLIQNGIPAAGRRSERREKVPDEALQALIQKQADMGRVGELVLVVDPVL